MLRSAILLSFIHLIAANIYAQQINTKGIKTVQQTTIDNNNGTVFTALEKEIHYNEENIMIHQKTSSYDFINGQVSKTSLYQFDYSPLTRKGEFSTTRYPTPKNKLESPAKSYTKFTSQNHKDNYLFTQVYDESGKLISETEENYNTQGLRTSKRVNDIRFQMINYDELQRNNAGKITRWISKDTENGKETIARDIQTTYLLDTLLLTEKGFSYNNWSETVNKYDKKNILIQQTVSRGYKQSTGKILIDAKTVTKYANNKPASATYTENGKKIATITYSYTDNSEIEIITAKRNKKTTVMKNETSREYNEKGSLASLKKIINDKPDFSMKHTYDENNKLIKTERWEYKVTGEVWYTEVFYNEKRNPTTSKEYKDNVLMKEHNYSYSYHPES